VLVVNNNKVEQTIPIPNTVMPIDILSLDNNLFILDSDAKVYEFTADGKVVNEYSLPQDLGSNSIIRLANNNDKVVLWTSGYYELPLENISKNADFQSMKDRIALGVKEQNNEISVIGEYVDYKRGRITSPDGSINIEIETDQAFGSATILKIDEKHVYVLVEELADPSPVIITEVTLRQYGYSGKLTGVIRLPDMDAFPVRPVEITENGDIYLLVNLRDAVNVYKVELGQKYTSILAEKRDQVLEKIREENIGQLAHDASLENMNNNKDISIQATFIGNPLSRQETRTRAYNMAMVTWTWNNKYDYDKNGKSRNTYTATKPAHLPSTDGVSQTGIPYLWGGWDSPYSHTDGAPWSNWASALSYYTNYGPIVGDTSSAGTVLTGGLGAGIDCSGFVASAAAVYSFSGTKPGTDVIFNNSIPVNDSNTGSGFSSWRALQPMDMFVKPGVHVLFYDYRASDGTGIYTVESTTDYGNVAGSNMQGAKFYKRNWSELTGYYHRTWWTKQAGDDIDVAITNWGASSVIRGQTKYYKFTNTTSSTDTKTVTVTPSSGNPDLYIYNASFTLIGSSKNALGTDKFTFTVAPYSTYYFAVYGSADSNYSISW